MSTHFIFGNQHESHFSDLRYGKCINKPFSEIKDLSYSEIYQLFYGKKLKIKTMKTANKLTQTTMKSIYGELILVLSSFIFNGDIIFICLYPEVGNIAVYNSKGQMLKINNGSFCFTKTSYIII